jgi:ABC-2 type transport system ATP-binding protein
MQNKGTESTIISIKDLTKSFKSRLPAEGLKNKVKSVFAPKYKTVNAVNNISFSIKKGELVGFIGPNGAGKSTTLKMLSGILFPNSGELTVCGLSPQKNRKKLAYKIGTIFGQKPQLWFHLPAIDTFELFSKIYELDKNEYKKRVDYLIKKFEIGKIIHQPVRKLSLGQRMRCEFVLALLHKPEVLFLDEPTIGLDITIKKTIRELIKKINKEEGVTVILTSHDMDDVETICNRVVVINHGEIIYDDTLDKIKEKYIDKKIIRIETNDPIIFKERKGIKVIRRSTFEVEAIVDTTKIDFSKITQDFLKKNSLSDVTIEEPPIEDIIEKIYKKKRKNKPVLRE